MSNPRPQPIQFGTRVSQHVSAPMNQELAENLYLEPAPEGSKFDYSILGTPGLKPFATVGTGPIRGAGSQRGELFVVSGNEIYSVSDKGVSHLIGQIAGTGYVRIVSNGTHLWVATNNKSYAVNSTEVIELSIKNVMGVANQDGYMIGVIGGTQKVWISNLDDATTIGGLDFTTADAFGDNCVGCISDHRELLVFKERSTEVYYNSGAAAFPFSRTQVVERGCISGDSVAKAQNSVFWLGDDLLVYRMDGYTPVPVSDERITRIIGSDDSPDTSVGFTYQQGGHTFYVLSFASVSLVYDLNTKLWHKRKSEGIQRWRVSYHAWMESWHKNIAFDYVTGDIYELDEKTYDENGAILRRRAIGPPVWGGGLRSVFDEFFLDVESGLGLVAGQGSDPKAVLDWSVDGGRTWSNELWRSFGAIGEYELRARWHRLGAHRNWMPRITITDPIPVRINGAYVRMEPLSL